jgi:hypothetical protein
LPAATPPLIVDADAMLSAPIAVQRFKTVARRNEQIFNSFGRVDGEKLRSRPALNLARKNLDRIAGKRRSSAFVGEGPDHD